MGMFDEITFEKAPIICKCGNKLDYFQTKDFDNVLDNYRIKENKDLEVQDWHLESIPENEQEELKKKSGFNWSPSLRRVNTGWSKVKWTEKIHCHSDCEKCRKYWFDLLLDIVKGKVRKIEVTIKEW